MGTSGEPPARLWCALLMATARGAAMAVPVVEDRLATARSAATDAPWAAVFPAWCGG